MKLIDPRLSVIEKRLENVKRIIPVASGKGGVGKSIISALLALLLKEKNYKIGLLDLDLYGPSLHILLNNQHSFPKEEYGLKPVNINNIDFMSIIYFTQNKPLIMRGKELTDTLIELFTITRWNSLDFLIIDMPPGMGEILLDLIRLINRLEFLIVTNSTKIAMETVEKLIIFLKDQNIPIIGLIENMKIGDQDFVKEKCNSLGINYLGKISFYHKLEDYYGDNKEIINSPISEEISQIVNFFV
uniref:ATP-binding protein n=1 Tax=Dictyoglomus thermophilum TaxID=14 RepID=A0A7C3MLA7_DICTH